MTEVWIMFAVLVAALVLGVPIPISVAIGTVIGYWLIDTPSSPSPRRCTRASSLFRC